MYFFFSIANMRLNDNIIALCRYVFECPGIGHQKHEPRQHQPKHDGDGNILLHGGKTFEGVVGVVDVHVW